MKYDRKAFFKEVKRLFGTLKQPQVNGFEFLLGAWESRYPEGSLKYLAYCLATAWHETATTMQPIEEYGKGKGHKYGPTGYYGRGYVQLTWDYNYLKATTRLHQLFGLDVDLLKHPEKALDPEIASLVMFIGMEEGWFTGRKLSQYFSGTEANPVAARHIINGTDCDEKIAGHYKNFVTALLASEEKD